MKFHDFCEATYVKTNIELQTQYSPQKQAKTLALQALINGQRSFLKAFYIPVVVFSYLFQALRLTTAPLPANELIKAYQDRAAQALAETKPSVVLSPIDLTK